MTSIRRFLIVVSLAVIVLVNFIAALQGYRTGLENTEQLMDDQLREKAQLIAQLAGNNSSLTVYNVPAPNFFFQVFDQNHQLIAHSEIAPMEVVTDHEDGFSSINVGGYRWRSFQLKQPESGLGILVAERMDSRYYLAEGIVLKTVIPILLGMPFLALLVWLLVTQGLRPLRKLTAQVEGKQSQDLTPIELKNAPKELTPLVVAMNNLLRRLSAAFEREKRFSSDAAHELRTPLSALKVNLYNLRKSLATESADADEMEQSVSRMSHLIEQLLLLYRMSPEQFQGSLEEVDLLAITQQVVVGLYPAMESKHQEIILDGDSVRLQGDAFALSTLVKNLLDNAIKYTPDNGEIIVTVYEKGDIIQLRIEDSGIGIPDALKSRVLERFYRVDGDQHNSGVQGCGLGLSIVQHIVDLHRGRLELSRSRFPTGLRVDVELPKSQEVEREDRS
ncbi:ATP-binding protein [Porticoccaceae bacterium LTM1]|nr:ATP-binding protein [Porticoccaceae bacterium LTM1]